MFKKYLDIIPKYFMMPDYDIKPETGWGNVKALKYEGIDYKGQKTAVFGYMGYPENSTEDKVPAILLVHGGGGHAYADWVKRWNDRGYAALAIDLRGAQPIESEKGLIGTESQRDELFFFFDGSDGYVSGPDGYNVYEEGNEIENVWFYRAIANTILAHNILLNDDRIDSEKIGITGISWGGNVTSQVIGYDKRFAFAIPVYGSAYLHNSLSSIMQVFKVDGALKYWQVHEKYDDIDFPVLWICWNKDTCFDLIPNCESYLKTEKSDSVLSICHEMGHAHWCGWVREECYSFADSVVFGAPKLLRVKNNSSDFLKGEFQIEGNIEDREVTATLFYITEEYKYSENSEPLFDWKTQPLEINGNIIKTEIPNLATAYYVELKEKINDKDLISTSVLIKK